MPENQPKTTVEYEVLDDEDFEHNLFDAAHKLYSDEKYVEALELFKSVLKTNANSFLYLDLGNCYYKLEQMEHAKSNWIKACQLDFNNAKAHVNLGNLYYKSNEIDSAIECWQAALLSNPKDEKTCLNLASAFDKKGMRFESVKYFEHYLLHSSNKASVDYINIKAQLKECRNVAEKYLSLGVKSQNIGDYSNASAYYLKSLSNYPNIYETNKRLGDLFFVEKNFEMTLKYWKIALIIEPNNAECLNSITKLQAFINPRVDYE